MAASTDFWPKLEDTQRAVIASACTYHNAPWCRDELKKHQLHFTKVLFPNRESASGVHNLVLAVAKDANVHEDGTSDVILYVAFPGTQTFADLLLDLDINHNRLSNYMGFLKGGVPGQYHGGFIQRLEEILPSMLPLCEFIREQQINRLIFCGHSLGGALAHLALIKFVITTSSITWLEDFLSECPMSIAFGSPHFCDAEAVQDFINLHQGFSRQMFTFINERDPVPHLLEDLGATKWAIYDLMAGRICCSLGQCLLGAGTSVIEDTGSTGFWNSGFSLCACCRALYYTTALSMDPRNAPKYVWAGLTASWPDQSRPDLPLTYYNEQPPAAHPALDLSSSTVRCHNMGLYVAHMCPILQRIPPRSAEQGNGEYVAPNVVEVRPNIAVEVRNIGPQIAECVMRFEGKHEIRKRCKIVVEGENLSLCHQWCVSTKGMSWPWSRRPLEWSLERCTDSKVVLNLEKEVDDAMVSFLTSTALTVFLTTPFGVSRKCGVEAQDPWFDSCVKCIMSCALAKLLLMRTCGQPLTDSHCREAVGALTSIDDIIFKAKAFVDFLDKAETQNFEEKFSFAWERFAEPVIEGLRKGMKTPKRALASLLNGAGANSRPYTGSLLPWGSIWVSYRTSLELLFQAIQPQGLSITPGRRNMSFFEYEMYAHWEQIKKILAMQVKSECVEELLKKGTILHRMFQAHDILGKVRTVVFMGPTFVGKSTLINCLLGREEDGTKAESSNVAVAGRGPAEAEEGRRRREARVEAFTVQLQRKDQEVVPVMLVEVPGSWGVERTWNQLVHVPDLVIVVVSFAGETAQEAEILAEGARRLGRCTNIVVVVNGMDRVLHGNSNSSVWTKYNPTFLTKLQREYARSAGRNVPPCNVNMCVAIPDVSLEATTLQNLQKLSQHVQFRSDITATLQKTILDLPHHHHCWGPSKH